MNNPRNIIKRPVITEHTADLMADKKYTIEVSPNANKTQIKDTSEADFGVKVEKKDTFEVKTKANKTESKDAIEAVFGVKVEKVNTLNLKGKFKRMGQYGGYRPNRKRAIVQLSEDSKELDFFEV